MRSNLGRSTLLAAVLISSLGVVPALRAQDEAGSAPAAAADQTMYTVGLVQLVGEGAEKEVGLIVPDWEMMLSVQALGMDVQKTMGEDNFKIILLVNDDNGKAIKALEGKAVAVEGKIEGDGDSAKFKVTKFAEMKDAMATEGLSQAAGDAKKKPAGAESK